MRATHPGKGKVESAKRLEVDRQIAMEAQRIGTLPAVRGTDYFATFAELVGTARPYWYKESRERKHERSEPRLRSCLLQLDFNPQPQKVRAVIQPPRTAGAEGAAD
jgi:hypothetical protein